MHHDTGPISSRLRNLLRDHTRVAGMKRLGFLTSEDDPDLIADDRLAFAPLAQLGFEVRPLVWDRPTTEFDVDALIFRSCWNYHRKFPRFLDFIARLKTLSIPVFNPLRVIEWNLNKKHIMEYESRLLVPKTEFFAAESAFHGHSVPGEKVVVKPAVSLNGHDTYLLDSPARVEEVMTELLPSRDMLIQEFVPEIQTQGEISLVYLKGELSHAVRKTPKPGEFRIHAEYGGTRTPVAVTPAVRAYAEQVLAAVPEPLLYARVDLVESRRGPMLIELEVTDPMLYLASSKGAEIRFAKAISDAVG